MSQNWPLNDTIPCDFHSWFWAIDTNVEKTLFEPAFDEPNHIPRETQYNETFDQQLNINLIKIA